MGKYVLVAFLQPVHQLYSNMACHAYSCFNKRNAFNAANNKINPVVLLLLPSTSTAGPSFTTRGL